MAEHPVNSANHTFNQAEWRDDLSERSRMSWKRLQTIEREVDAVHLKSHRHTVSCPKAIRRLDHPIHYAGVAATAFEQETAAQCEMADGVGCEPTVSLHPRRLRSEEKTSELQSLMRISD